MRERNEEGKGRRETYPTNQPNCKVCARAMSRCGRGVSGGGAMIVGCTVLFYSFIFILPSREKLYVVKDTVTVALSVELRGDDRRKGKGGRTEDEGEERTEERREGGEVGGWDKVGTTSGVKVVRECRHTVPD